MPSQVVETIDDLFPDAQGMLGIGYTLQLLCVLNLLKDVPEQLIILSSADYAKLVLAKCTIEEMLAIWRSRAGSGEMLYADRAKTVAEVRRLLAKCPDEYPPSAAADLLFINDAALRDNIRGDLGAAERALNNAEWKAATVLAGATIEALLHWRLQQPSPGLAAVQAAAATLAASGKTGKPHNHIDNWTLQQFIEVAAHLDLLKPDTCSAARLAQNFRNLIHPGRAARLAQTCDRGTAYSAGGALEHVIRDLIGPR
jgi:hypothetical protein